MKGNPEVRAASLAHVFTVGCVALASDFAVRDEDEEGGRIRVLGRRRVGLLDESYERSVVVRDGVDERALVPAWVAAALPGGVQDIPVCSTVSMAGG